MAKPFTITCDLCKHDIAFDTDEVEGLDSFIDDERREAADEVRDDYDGDSIESGTLTGGQRPLRELAVAIRRCPPGPWRNEAEHWLDRITRELGSEAQEQVEQARYSPEARRAR